MHFKQKRESKLFVNCSYTSFKLKLTRQVDRHRRGFNLTLLVHFLQRSYGITVHVDSLTMKDILMRSQLALHTIYTPQHLPCFNTTRTQFEPGQAGRITTVCLVPAVCARGTTCPAQHVEPAVVHASGCSSAPREVSDDCHLAITKKNDQPGDAGPHDTPFQRKCSRLVDRYRIRTSSNRSIVDQCQKGLDTCSCGLQKRCSPISVN